MRLTRLTRWFKSRATRAAPNPAQAEILATIKFPCC